MLSKKIRSGLTILLLLGHPLFAQLTNDNPLFQLVAWQHTDQASLVTLLGEEAEPGYSAVGSLFVRGQLCQFTER